ncbi:hypothetical protein C8R44DRAFT_978219 [Mycena epipterygia]|nr:hypothetical protein C8R44DRAFT_978219 [Mycena epipterygia]
MSILDDTLSVLAILDTTASIAAPLSDPIGIDATILGGVELPDIPPPFEPLILVPLGRNDVHDTTSCVDGSYMVPLDFLTNPDPDTIDTIDVTPQRLSCDGCPQTYAHPGSLKRHVDRNRSGGHFSDARVEFLATFNELPAVLNVRTGRMAGTPDVAVNKELNKMFNALFAASKARKT